jgi:hypothetical protein
VTRPRSIVGTSLWREKTEASFDRPAQKMTVSSAEIPRCNAGRSREKNPGPLRPRRFVILAQTLLDGRLLDVQCYVVKNE